MKRALWITAITVLIGGSAGIVALHFHQSKPIQTFQSIEQRDRSRPKFSKMASPSRFIIPSLGIEKSIIGVGLTPNGDMDTPPDNDSLGWYMNNPKPGDSGAAVLAAHAGPPENPSIFQRLQSLKKGAVIKIEDKSSNIALFEVTETATYQPNTAPRERIFGKTKEPRLAIITCTGEWLPSDQTYSDRFVVFATRKL